MDRIKQTVLLLGVLGLLLFGCADSNYNDAKDYYPVTQYAKGYILHWGKNNNIKINTNSDNVTFTDNESNYISSFKEGLAEWNDTLSTLGISIEYVTSGADVNVKWVSGSDLSTGVLGYATTGKIIKMSLTNNSTGKSHSDSMVKFIAIHEFGHMLGIWSHSFDVNDIMYPTADGPMALSNRDKNTVMNFLYNLAPTQDMHDRSGPLVQHGTGSVLPHVKTYFTTKGCVLEIGSESSNRSQFDLR